MTDAPVVPWPLRAGWVALAAGALVTAGTIERVAHDSVATWWMLGLGTLGVLWFRATERRIFALSYGCNLLAAVALLSHAAATRGDLLVVGNDAFFFESSRALADAFLEENWSAIGDYTRLSGAGYIALNALVFWFAGDYAYPTAATMAVLNAAVGATLPIVAYRVGQRYSGGVSRLALMAATVTSLAPTLLFYAGVALRDVWVTTFSAWAMWAMLTVLTPGARRRFVSVIGGAIALAIVTAMRPVSAVPLVLFAVALVMFQARHRLLTAVLLITLGLSGGAAAWLQRSAAQFSETSDIYEELSLSRADADSVGARLLQLPTPVNHATRFVLAMFVPVPPPLSADPRGLLLGLGAVMGYFMLPFMAQGAVAAWRSPSLGSYVRAGTLFALVVLASISQTSLDVRHKTVIWPFGIQLTVIGWYAADWRRRLELFFGMAGLLVVLGLVYLVFKTLEG